MFSLAVRGHQKLHFSYTLHMVGLTPQPYMRKVPTPKLKQALGFKLIYTQKTPDCQPPQKSFGGLYLGLCNCAITHAYIISFPQDNSNRHVPRPFLLPVRRVLFPTKGGMDLQFMWVNVGSA